MGKGSSNIRIVIADDHKMVREGLRRFLQDEADFDIVGEASDGVEAMRLVASLRPDVLLLDLYMPNMDGLETLRQIAAANLPVRTILLSAAIEKREVVEALPLGIRGAISKGVGASVLVRAIRCVHAGEYWIERDTLATWARQRQGSAKGRLPEKPMPLLTARELEIVREIALGSTNHTIAQKLNISEETVKRHLSNVYEKLGISSRVGLALYAVNHRLLE